MSRFLDWAARLTKNHRGSTITRNQHRRFALKHFVTMAIWLFFSLPVIAKGYVEQYTTQRISGWACDVRYPDDNVAIHVWRDDNKFLGGVGAVINREPAVGAACGGTHSAHGFSVDLYFGEELKDGKSHKIHVYLIGRDNFVEQLNNSPVTITYPGSIQEKPYWAGDVVARDLAWPVIGGAGHIGIWDGAFVIEVLDTGANSVQKNSYENFYARSKAWPVLYSPAWPTHVIQGCFASYCDSRTDPNNQPSYSAVYAMVARANQILAIGADYRWDKYIYPAVPRYYQQDPLFGDQILAPLRGKYRCDTFILDLMSATVNSPSFLYAYSEFAYGIVQYNPFHSKRLAKVNIGPTQYGGTGWYPKYVSAMEATVITPVTLYNRIKSGFPQ